MLYGLENHPQYLWGREITLVVVVAIKPLRVSRLLVTIVGDEQLNSRYFSKRYKIAKKVGFLVLLDCALVMQS